MFTLKSNTSRLAITAAVLVSLPASVQAQGGAQDGAGEAEPVESENVIVVTARSREENIQDVPLAITAVTAEDIERKSIENLSDVARFTAGFSFENLGGGNAAPTIRGQSAIDTGGREQPTATFFDGVYLPRSWLVDAGTTNLQRIEIVKGPQSARFGRNAFSGAINFIPKKADTFETTLQASATYGNHDRFDVGGNFNLVLEDDILAIAGSFSHSEFDGSWRNDHPFANAGISPGTEGRVGGRDNQSYSFGFIMKPNERVTVEAAYYHFDRDEESPAQEFLDTGDGTGNCGTIINGNSRLFCGEFPGTGDAVTIEPRSFSRQSDVNLVRANANFELNDTLDFNYTLGFIDANTLSAVSAESDPVNCGSILPPFIVQGGVSLCNFQATPLGSVDYTSHEARLTFDNRDNLRLAIGGFYLDGEDDSFFVSANQPVLSATNLTPLDITSNSSGPLTSFFPLIPGEFANLVIGNDKVTTEVYALFGELGIAFNGGRTRFSAEGRYTSEEISSDTLAASETFNFFTPRVTLEHDMSDDMLIYASVARGVKAGGFNGAVVGGNTSPVFTFDEETNWTYEIGSKNTILGGRGTLNLAAFYTDWTDQQVNAADPNGSIISTSITRNLGDTRVWGVEMEGAIDLTENLSVDLSGSYTDAQFRDGTVDQVFARFGGPNTAPPCDDLVCNSNGDIGGNELPRAPKFQAALGVQYSRDINQDTDFYIRADGSYQSRSFADTVNVAVIGDRFLANSRLGLNYRNFGLSIWGRNIFDKRYVSNSTQIIQRSGDNILSRNFGDRRTIGATVSVRY